VNRLATALATVMRDVAGRGHAAALVGGLAVSARAEPRLTRDVDLVVAVATDQEAEHVVQALVSAGHETVALVEQEATGRLATVRLTPPGESASGVVAGLLFASSGIEALVAASAELLDVFPGVTVPVARVGHLVALKLLSRDDRTRPQDASGLRALRRVSSLSERRRALDAIQQIEERGFARGRDLRAAFTEWSSDAD
jgi:hypothetical protein